MAIAHDTVSRGKKRSLDDDKKSSSIKAKWTKKNGDKGVGKNVSKKNSQNEKHKSAKDDAASLKKERNKKEVKRQRQERENPNFLTEMSLKKLWGSLRNSQDDKQREENVNKILEKAKEDGKSLVDFVFAHDTTRVLQACIQHGTTAQRRHIFEELKPKVSDMARSEYAKHVVWKLIKYCERDIKDYCIENLGNVRKLIRSNVGQSVLEYAYNQFAQSKQRTKLVKPLYGKTYNKLSKLHPNITILECCQKNTDFVETILKDFMDDLKPLTEKEAIKQTVSHRAFLDFFNVTLYLINSDEPKFVEKKKQITEIRNELIEQLRASVIHMIHTPDGARVGMHCIWFGTAKDRKLIIKTIKEFLEKVVTAEFGHLLFLGIIDAVDDTVTVRKSLVSGVLKILDDIMFDKYARKVVWYLLAGRDRRAFFPDVIKFLAIGDMTETSKKPREVKLNELQSHAIPPILEWFSENVDKCVEDSSLCPILVVAMKHATHVMKQDENVLVTLQAAIAKKIAVRNYADAVHPLNHTHVTMSLKKLLINDKEKDCDRFITQVSNYCLPVMKDWLNDNKGCFLLLQCLEVNNAECNKKICEELEQEIVSRRDDISKTKGGQLLMQKAFDSEGKMRLVLEDFSKSVDKKSSEPLSKKPKME